MNIEDIKVGRTYRHAESPDEYSAIAMCKIKDEKTGEWIPGVAYARVFVENGEQPVYVRTKRNFADRFTQVRS